MMLAPFEICYYNLTTPLLQLKTTLILSQFITKRQTIWSALKERSTFWWLLLVKIQEAVTQTALIHYIFGMGRVLLDFLAQICYVKSQKLFVVAVFAAPH